MSPAYAVHKADQQHTKDPERGDGGEEHEKDNANTQNKVGDDLICTKAAERSHQQREVLPALSVAPKTIVCMEQKLKCNRTKIEENQVWNQISCPYGV